MHSHWISASSRVVVSSQDVPLLVVEHLLDPLLVSHADTLLRPSGFQAGQL